MTNPAAVLNATTLGCSMTCKDVGASIRWYHEVLGFVVHQRFERDGKVVGAIVKLGVSTPLKA